MASGAAGLIQQIQIDDGGKHNFASTAYGICNTEANNANKVVEMTGFTLIEGTTVHIKFTHNNTVANPTLNINGTGAKPIVQYGTTVAGTTDSTSGWYAGAILALTYDGTDWIRDQGFNTNNTYTITSVWCNTKAATAAKTFSNASYYAANDKSYFEITFRYANSAESALTLNGKTLYINGEPSSADNHTIPAGKYLVYYDNNIYYIRTDGKITGDITGDAATVNGLTVETAVPPNAKFTDTNKYHKSGSWSGLTYTATAVNGADELKFTIPDNYGDTKNPYASKTKNYVLAAPSNANGVPSFRALVTDDIPNSILKWQTTTVASTELYDFGVYVNQNHAANSSMNGGNYFNILNVPYRKASGNTKADWGWQLGNTTSNDGRLWYRTAGDNVWGEWQIIAHATQSTSNIGSATQPVYMTAAGVITAGTALKALAYKDSLTSSDIPDNAANTTGNAATASSAAKLTTARNLGVALGSTAAVTFDGSANQTSIPVSGTLGIAHGGTGQTTLTAARQQFSGPEFIIGTWTAASGTWTGTTTDSELYDGKQIILYMPFAGSGNATLNLTLADGTTTGAKNVYFESTTRFTTHKGQNAQLHLIYHKALKLSNGTTYEGWWYVANRDTDNDYRTRQNVLADTDTSNRSLLLSNPVVGTANNNTAYVTYRNDNIYANVSTGIITATGFNGNLTGNVTGNVSGSSGSCTGNAATATTATNLSAKPSLAASGNNITVTAGGKTSDAFTVPYATSAGSATTATYIKCTDTRNATLNPTDLTAAQGVRFDFKAKGTISLTAADAHAGVMSFRPYASNSDWSGGNAHQLAFNSEGLHWRTGGASWGEWNQILDSDNTAAGANATASLSWSSTYTLAKINGTDIKITTMAKPSYAFTDLTEHPTTLSGYGITDAAVKSHSHTLTIGNKSLSVSTSTQEWTVHDILYNTNTIQKSTSWNITTPGIYGVTNSSHDGDGHPGSTSGQTAPYAYGHLIITRAGGYGAAQIYISDIASGPKAANKGIRYRSGWNVVNNPETGWKEWATILDDKNFNLYAPTLTGAGASGSWGISITGTAAKATADASGNTITSTYATKTEIEGLLAAADAMIFKGVINATNGLPDSHSAGDTYRVGAEGTYPIVDSNGRYCEEGTLIICITNGTTANPAHWTAVETNEDGAVIGPASSKGNNIVTFSGNTGRIIQDSGKAFSTATPGSSSTNAQVPTAKAVWAAINALDANLNNTTPGAGKTLTAFSQTNGKVSATFGDISITKSQVSDFAHDHDAAYLKLNGSNNMTADVNIIAGDTDKFVNFWYNANKTAGASWRIGELGSGSSDANYFVIQSGTSDSSKTAWNDAIQIGANTFNVYLPSTTASTSTTTGALKVAGGVGVAGQVTATRLAANGSNTSYNLYVNGTSYFNGNVTHNGIVYFKNDQSYYINKNAQGYLDKLQAGNIRLTENKVEFYTTNADVSQTSSGNSLCGDISATAAANTSVPATMSFNIVQGASLVNSNFIFNGDIIPQSNATYSLGSISNHWKNAYINNTIFVSAKAQSISSYSDSSSSDNLAFSYISPGLISVNINGVIPSNGSGYYLINAGQQYARLYIQVIGQTDSIGQTVLELGNSVGSGTANNAYGTLHLYNTDTTSARYTATGWTGSGISNFTILGATSTAQNTTAWSTLILGNNKSAATTDPHSQGKIRIYSSGTVYTEIQSQIPDQVGQDSGYTVYLPKYSANMYLAHVGDNSAVGSGTQPVYVAENGRITASTNTVGDAYTPVYSNQGVLTATAPVQYNTFTIVDSDTQVDLNNDAYTADTYVLTIVITSGEANINAPINWTSSTGKVRLSTTVAVSGDVSGYILTARGTSLT